MSRTKEEEPVPTSLVDSLLTLRESLVSQDDNDEEEDDNDAADVYHETMNICETILQREDLSPSIQKTVYEIWMKCALEVEDYELVLKLCRQQDNHHHHNYDSWEAYALYRLHKYKEAHAKIQNSSNNDDHDDLLLGQHIQAQSLFRLWNTQEALEQYLQILSSSTTNDDDEEDDSRMETMTNAIAVTHGNQVPFASSSSSSSLAKTLVDRATTTLANHKEEDDEEYPYDLAYNVATYQLLHGGTSSIASAMTYLQQARQACQEEKEEDGGFSTTDIQKELMPIVTNLALATATQQTLQPQEDGGGSSTTAVPPTTTDTKQSFDLDVWNIYEALHKRTSTTTTTTMTATLDTATKRLLKKEPPTNWTLLQKCIFSYNIALLALRTGQHSHCRHALKQIESRLKKNNHHPTFVWWQSRMDVMEAYCLVKEQKQEEALTFLQTQLSTFVEQQHSKTTTTTTTSMEKDELYQSAMAYLKLHLGMMLEGTTTTTMTKESMIALLEGLPPLIRHKRGVMATLASLYHETGQPRPPQEDTDITTTLDDASQAELYMAQGNYPKAAEFYETLLSNNTAEEEEEESRRLMWKTQYVHALTYMDAEQAETLWEELQKEWGDDEEEDDSDVSDDAGELLEEAELPRLKKTKSRGASSTTVATTTGPSSTTTTTAKKKKKNHESILRRRAKRREAYLKAKGIPDTQKPNPERWIPKHERYGRRRRGNRGGGPAKAHQGGGSQKDAAKLDAAARAQAKAAGLLDDPSTNARSTAHYSVAGGPKRGGGGGGRRR